MYVREREGARACALSGVGCTYFSQASSLPLSPMLSSLLTVGVSIIFPTPGAVWEPTADLLLGLSSLPDFAVDLPPPFLLRHPPLPPL